MPDSKIYYSIKEVSEMTNLPFSTLRYWEEQFEQLVPRKDGHNNRYYTKENIEFIKRVKYIRDELKITRIDAIRRELKTTPAKSICVSVLPKHCCVFVRN